MGCERCGYVRTETKPVKGCSACYQWWQRRYGPPAPCCGKPLYSNGKCLKCYRDESCARTEARKAKAREYHQRTGGVGTRKYRRKSDPNASLERKVGECESPGCDYVGPLDWDHDHATGLFRGWLCRPCNVALGLLKDSPMRILGLNTYITRGR